MKTIFSLLFGSLSAFGSIYAAPDVKINTPGKPHIVFLISEDKDNYEAHLTIPKFAKKLRQEYNFKTTVILGKGERTAFRYPGLKQIKNADLLVIFTRRVALAPDQMDLIKEYLADGKPLVGIRTANHAFTVRDQIGEGYIDWKEFVPDILGCKNRGYGPVGPGIDVKVNPTQNNHPIVQKLSTKDWHSKGNIYLVSPLIDPKIEVLLNGKSDGKKEPIAWVRKTQNNSKIFYTSLGHPSDFETVEFTELLINGINWAINE